MAERQRCEICNRSFKSQEGLDMHNGAKHSSSKDETKKEKNIIKISPKKVRKQLIWVVILGLVIWGVYAIFSSGGGAVFPPTDMQGHVELSPDSHVLKEPMPIAIQKHMLEHADGEDSSSGGIIISYNCEDYICEDGLIENLEAFSQVYPENVYVAPFKNMGAKIVLTKLGRLEILEEYSENKIHLFISGTIPGNENLVSPTQGDSGQSQIFEELSSQETNIKEFSIVAKQWQFSPSKIEVNEGDSVVLNVRSVDVAHGIAIPAFGVNEYLSPGQTVRMEFVANKKGTFTFSCSVSCGVGHTGMIGKLIVK